MAVAFDTRAKWYGRIDEEQKAAKATPPDNPPPLAAFDLDILGRDSWGSRLRVRLLHAFFVGYFWLARKFWPFPPLPSFWSVVCVTRAADVKEVLNDTETFEVPYGPEMMELAEGANFVLGMDGPNHDRQRAFLQEVMQRGDQERLAVSSREVAQALIDGSGGVIDVMSDFVTRVATETCGRYFGLQIDEPDAFAEWALSLSTLLFADPSGIPETRALALNGSARLCAVIDRAIDQSKSDPERGADTLVDRLVALQTPSRPPEARPEDKEIRAMLVGLVVGFIPTTTLAAGRMLEELLRRPKQFAAAKQSARGGDRDGLSAILWEAARLNPALQPGQWRYARKDGRIGTGFRSRRIRKGTTLMVATMSALRDGRVYRAPGRFRTDREPKPDFIFGWGAHDCLGWRLAMMQITEVFLLLLAQKRLRPVPGRAGGLAWVGPLPRRLDMQFEDAAVPREQSMITIWAPIKPGVTKQVLDDKIARLGNPAQPGSDIGAALCATGLVHFASMATVDIGTPDKPSLFLLLELNVDGPADAALKSVAEKAAAPLAPIFKHVASTEKSLFDTLRKHVLKFGTAPWGTIGLDFNGTPETPVADIEQQAALASFCRQALRRFLGRELGLGSRPLNAVHFIRKLIAQDPHLVRKAAADAELAALLKDGAAFRNFLIRPRSRRPDFPNWVDPGTWTPMQQLRDFFVSSAGRAIAWWLVRFGLFLTAADYLGISLIFARPAPRSFVQGLLAAIGWEPDTALPMALIHLTGRIILALVSGFGIEALILGFAIGGFAWFLRRKEQADASDDETPPLASVRASEQSENPPGYLQNHFMAVTQLKPGRFRLLTLWIALYGIGLMVANRFRKGFVLNMGTIHYAQWVRPKGTDKLLFLSNYDGSWESYLEDFIMRAHQGMTAAWSNGVGFPQTSFLVNGGAADGDRFKRWVRRQQQVAPFWFSRFPTLTTAQIRDNCLIHYGLMRVRNDGGARAWLDCFGSMQRPDDTIEADEVQSLVFTGLSDLPYAACLVLELPKDAASRRDWLSGVMPDSSAPQLQPLCFGDLPKEAGGRDGAAHLAFSASGLAKFGLPPADGTDGLATFAGAFNMGMAARSRVLGDTGRSAPAHWDWSDGDATDGVLFLYARSPVACRQLVDAHVSWLELHGGTAKRLVTEPVEDHDADQYRREHFGFRDGISQPILRGTQRHTRDALSRDVVAPGEFLFGYANNQGYFAPSPIVRAESDRSDSLPIPMAAQETAEFDGATSKFPDFDTLSPLYQPRDFGRNGCFLVVRQLQQDVGAFEDFITEAAEQVNAAYPHAGQVIGNPATPEWIAAKIVGRWRDGTPLLDRAAPELPPAHDDPARVDPAHFDRPGRCPARHHAHHHGAVDNDFAYGTDDPSGLRCPLGAHIRRANPRDSLNPGAPDEQSITNRHRLLRRGRSYTRADEKGLLFVALCADLERQFEFVQQNWLASSAFDGLTQEVDPLQAEGDSPPGNFTIPTPAGPIVLRSLASFVTVKAGGYFFLPSRSALNYLIAL